MSNILQPLANATYDCIIAIRNMYYKLPNYVEYPISNDINYGNLWIPIGVRGRKEIHYLRIGGDCSHTYIVGQTGSGKSNLVKVILSTIINNYPTTQLILLDYKRVELSLFKHTKNCIQFEYDEDKISKALDDILTLVLHRYEMLDNKSLTEADYTMNNVLVVIEEISLMLKKDMKVLRKIMAISRAVKVFILFTTQRPSNECLDNVVKSLVGNRICLKTDDIKNSILALDTEGCELLKGKGHGYIKSDGYITEFQSYHISDTTVKDICAIHNTDKTDLKVVENVSNTEEVQIHHKPIDDEIKTPPTIIYNNEEQKDIEIIQNTDWLDKL